MDEQSTRVGGVTREIKGLMGKEDVTQAEQLLRMIGKELQAIRVACVKTANWVQFLGVVVLIGIVFAFAYGAGTTEP